MKRTDVENYQIRYNNRLQEFGYDPKTLGWGGGKEKQFHRFEALRQIGISEKDSVLDVGCGFGDLYGYLQMKGWKGEYLGVDINEKLLEVSKEIFPGINVKVLDIEETAVDFKYDWVIASGIFNAKLLEENNSEYIERMLKKMFEIANKGVASDFLSTYVDFQHPDAFHSDPKWMIDVIKRFCDKAVVRMDFLPYEFCIYLKK